MKSSITEHPYGALSIPVSSPEERHARARHGLDHVAVLDPEQLPLALVFLSGYYPRVFDAVMEAIEPRGGPGVEDETSAQEQFCVKCDAPVGVVTGTREGVPALPRRPHRD